MATPDTALARTPQVREHLVFPYPPEDPDDKMASFDQLSVTGTAHALGSGSWRSGWIARERNFVARVV